MLTMADTAWEAATVDRPGAKFAAFEPDGPQGPALEFDIIHAVPEHALAIARLDVARSGGDAEQIRPLVEKDLQTIASGGVPRLVLVASTAGEVCGYAKAAYVRPSQDPRARHVPDGWYLTGIVVSEAYRRAGMGRRLTEARIAEIRARGGTEVYYFANARNLASVALHAALGFAAVTRDFVFPGTTFDGGVGILFRRNV
jgi:ribosomal protein S18 acetylase RimI-like enzyme